MWHQKPWQCHCLRQRRSRRHHSFSVPPVLYSHRSCDRSTLPARLSAHPPPFCTCDVYALLYPTRCASAVQFLFTCRERSLPYVFHNHFRHHSVPAVASLLCAHRQSTPCQRTYCPGSLCICVVARRVCLCSPTCVIITTSCSVSDADCASASNAPSIVPLSLTRRVRACVCVCVCVCVSVCVCLCV
jgi:hypothetical protein